MVEATESDQILSEGAPIRLVDGRVFHLRYTFRGLKRLEDTFGDTKSIDRAIKDAMSGGKGKSFTRLGELLIAGLLHYGMEDNALLDLLDLRQVVEYGQAIGTALAQAFGEVTSEGKALQPETANGSHGDAGTTSPPESSGVATVTSGG